MAKLRELLIVWAVPDMGRSRLVPAVTFLVHVSGWLMTLVQTSLQLRGGERRATLARRRCAGMPTSLVQAVSAPSLPRPAAPIARWVAFQLQGILAFANDEACVYLLAGERAAYIGSSRQAHRRVGDRNLGLPDVRFGQHLRSIVRQDIRGGLHKTTAFAREPPGMVALFVVARGPEDAMRALEAALIRRVAPLGNTSLATKGGWRRNAEVTNAEAEHGRRRPWPWQRRKLDSPGPAISARDLVLLGLPRLLERWCARMAARRQAAAARELREVHYDEAQRFRATPAGRLDGPIDLYAESSFDLLIAWIATRGTDMDWLHLERAGGRRALYRVGFALLHMRRPGRRLEGLRRWRHGAALLGELPWALPVVRLPRDLAPECRRDIVRRLRDALADGCAWRRAWVTERLRCVQAPATTVARRRFGMAQAARDADCARLRAMPEAWQARAAAGLDLRRIKKYWKVPDIVTPMDRWRALTLELEALAARVRRSRPTLCTDWRLVALPTLGQPTLPMTKELEQYYPSLPVPRPDEVAIIEDKDTNAGWLMNREAYQWRGLRCIEGDGVWLRTKLSGIAAARRIAEPFHALPRGAQMSGGWRGYPPSMPPRNPNAGWMVLMCVGERGTAASGGSPLGHASRAARRCAGSARPGE